MTIIRAFLILTITILLTLCNSVIAKPDYYGKRLCSNDRYVCHKVKRGETWRKLFPNSDQQDIVKRVNRRNMQLRSGMIIAIPKDLKRITHFDVAPFPLKIEPTGQKRIIVDLTALAWAAYDADGHLIHWGPASGGRGWCKDVGRPCRTATGNYILNSKKGYDCISSKFPLPFGGAAMPYCMHYYRAYALHGSFEVPGYNTSHGCIRLFITDARWLNYDFTDYNTKVIVRPY